MWETQRVLPTGLDERSWGSLVAQFRFAGLEVVPLVDAIGLYAESKAMDNCVYTYVKKCLGGQRRLFSIRRDGSSIATMEIARCGDAWELLQVKGYANRPPDPIAVLVANEACDRYCEIWYTLIESGKVPSAASRNRRRALPPPGYAGTRPANSAVANPEPRSELPKRADALR